MTVTQRTYILIFLSVTIKNEGSGKDSIRVDNLQQNSWWKACFSRKKNVENVWKTLMRIKIFYNTFWRVIIRVLVKRMCSQTNKLFVITSNLFICRSSSRLMSLIKRHTGKNSFLHVIDVAKKSCSWTPFFCTLKLSFPAINLFSCQPREWKRSTRAFSQLLELCTKLRWSYLSAVEIYVQRIPWSGNYFFQVVQALVFD